MQKMQRPQPRRMVTDVMFKGGWFVWECFDTGYRSPVCQPGKARSGLWPRDRRFGVYGRSDIRFQACTKPEDWT